MLHTFTKCPKTFSKCLKTFLKCMKTFLKCFRADVSLSFAFRLVPGKKAVGSELHMLWRDVRRYALNFFWLKS